jgi:predicted permease
VIGWVGLRLLVTRAPVELPRVHEIGVDGATVGFTVAVSLITALVLGSFPLVRIGGRAFAHVLGEGGRGATTGPERHRVRSVLVSGQLALAAVLLVGCGLMVRSFVALRSVDAGIDPENVLVVGIRPGDATDLHQGASFYQRVADEVAALPGVRSVGLTTYVPMSGGSATAGSVIVESRSGAEVALPEVAFYKAIGADYVGAIGQRLVRGRDLERSDWEGGEPVALVNEVFAERFLGPDAIGEGIKVDADLPFARVVGVLADVREQGLREEPIPWIYFPMVVGNWGYPALGQGYVVARTNGRTQVPVQAVRDIVGRLDPYAPITTARFMTEVMAEQVAVTSFTLVMLGIAAVMALFLGAIGLFGVVSYVIGLRTREIGVRVALGARSLDIEAMIFRQAGALIVIGIAIGLLAAGGLTRLMASLLYGVSPLDPLAFLASPLLLGGIGLLAALGPARRASRIAPVEALRSE